MSPPGKRASGGLARSSTTSRSSLRLAISCKRGNHPGGQAVKQETEVVLYYRFLFYQDCYACLEELTRLRKY